jgi:hypothetical protein
VIRAVTLLLLLSVLDLNGAASCGNLWGTCSATKLCSHCCSQHGWCGKSATYCDHKNAAFSHCTKTPTKCPTADPTAPTKCPTVSPTKYVCERCEAGRRRSVPCLDMRTELLMGCIACSAGQYRPVAHTDTTCLACPSGKYYDGKDLYQGKQCAVCKLCSKGEYVSCNSLSSSCKSCPSGQYQTHKSHSRHTCTTCSACTTNGTFWSCNKQSGTHCTSCHAGQFLSSSNHRAAVCTDCKSGSSGCPSGKFLVGCFDTGNAYDDTQCKGGCPGGFYGVQKEGVEEIYCEEWAPSLAGATTRTCEVFNLVPKVDCAACPRGYAQPSASQTSCIECSGGRYAEDSAALQCTGCAAGLWSVALSSECTACTTSKYGLTEPANRSSEAVHCASCPFGKYQVRTCVRGANTQYCPL